MKKEMIRVSEYARLLNISRTAVDMKIKLGKLASKEIGGIRHVKYPSEETIKKYTDA